MTENATRSARCCCGSIRLQTVGEPLTVSVCHCLDCQRRTGSILGTQVRFPNENVSVQGRPKVFERTGDTGAKVTFHFCPECGTTLFWKAEKLEGFTVVALGAFEERGFSSPTYSVYECRQQPWVQLVGEMGRYD